MEGGYDWVCVYEDGTLHRNKYGSEVDHERVCLVRLEPHDPDNKEFEVEINLEEGERFLRCQRKLIKVAMGGDNVDLKHGYKLGLNVINVIGIKRGDQISYLTVRPDGSSLLSTTRNRE